MSSTEFAVDGVHGRIMGRRWAPGADPVRIVLLAHGYGEHSGRYEHVAAALTADGAVVYAPDHLGHGRSEGERVLVEDIDDIVRDFHAVADRARSDHPGLPLVVLGHSMGGVIATRFVQLYQDEAAALVLSGPVIGGSPDIAALLDMDPIPDVPIDPAVLSRDPAVGEAYAADALVWHGPFKRPTLKALFAAVDRISSGPALGALPTLWLHGEDDALVPLAATREAIEKIRGDDFEEHVYPGARHEVFNETNKDEVLGHVAAFLTAKVPAGTAA